MSESKGIILYRKLVNAAMVVLVFALIAGLAYGVYRATPSAKMLVQAGQEAQSVELRGLMGLADSKDLTWEEKQYKKHCEPLPKKKMLRKECERFEKRQREKEKEKQI